MLKSSSDKPGMHLDAKPKLFQYARLNRCQPTQTEDILWSALQRKQLDGFKFRRQHPISLYILDFYCHACKLSIELDGGYHSIESQKEYDKNRSTDLDAIGILELRFTNEEVLQDFSSVLGSIKEALEERKRMLSGEREITPDP